MDDTIEPAPFESSSSSLSLSSRLLPQCYCVIQVSSYNPLDFHAVMWDATVTTDQDKERWIQQGVTFLNHDPRSKNQLHSQELPSPIPPLPVVMDEHDTTHSLNYQDQNNPSSMVLGHLMSNHRLWGLVQEYGGPCGVLAVLQAELIRFLLYEWSAEKISNSEDDKRRANNLNLSIDVVREKLALAMGCILTRAAMAPLASDTDESSSTDESKSAARRPHCTRVVLPSVLCRTSELKSTDFDPWRGEAHSSPTLIPSSSTSSSSFSSSSHLSVYTIRPSKTEEIIPDNVTTPLFPDTSGNDVPNSTHKRLRFANDDRFGPKPNCLGEALVSNDNNIGKPLLQQLTTATASFLLTPLLSIRQDRTPVAPMDCILQPGGILLFTMSLVATRGARVIASESDDTSLNRLTAQFGHCSQELINLLLTGQATSNVFDHTMDVAEVVCRGVSSRPVIGYLSQLEALRYCQVGEYCKNPHYPIWVVGSTSHFTVLVGSDDAVHESSSDQILERCRRAFRKFAKDECGFIDVNLLYSVSQELNMILDESTIQMLGATLVVSGVGIIIWDDFWKTFSRLLTGASVESVLLFQEDGNTGRSNDITAGDQVLATTLPDDTTSVSVLDLNDGGFGKTCATTAVPASATPKPTSTETDEEMARRLQAEWDAVDRTISNVYDGASVTVLPPSPSPSLSESGSPSNSNSPVSPSTLTVYTDENPITFSLTNSRPSSPISDEPLRSISSGFEKYGTSFDLYHYNGLRGGTLTPFRVTRLTAEEAVGSSASLHRSARANARNSVDLEDVIRTRWPSCRIDWLGRDPPYID